MGVHLRLRALQFTWALCLGLTLRAVDTDTQDSLVHSQLKWKAVIKESIFGKHRNLSGIVAVMSRNRLVFAQGYGHFDRHHIRPTSLFPSSSLSKLLTSVAILKLVGDGRLKLDRKVFGHKGILNKMYPPYGSRPDPRLGDITVEHLLRHTAGWDSRKGPLYDPMLNQFYLARGNTVPDIAREMHVPHNKLRHHHIIQYMTGQPLDFSPGTQSQFSNLGYCILGRIIEEVAGTSYEDYVHNSVLVPVGMWRTSLGASKNHPSARHFVTQLSRQIKHPSKHNPTSPAAPKFYYAVTHSRLCDSVSGWFFSIYDALRLMDCIQDQTTCNLLKANVAELFFAKPQLPFPQHVDTWHTVGFRLRNDGTFWSQPDTLGDHATIFSRGHYIREKTEDKSQSSFVFKNEQRTMILFTSVTLSNNRYQNTMEHALNSMKNQPDDRNDFISDLSNSHFVVKDTDIVIRYKLSEHRLQAYANAMRRLDYIPQWIQAYTHKKRTFFVCIFKKVKNQSVAPYRILSGTKKKIDLLVKEYEMKGYSITNVQTYESHSHAGKLLHLVTMNRIKDKSVKYAIGKPVGDFEFLNSFQQKGYLLTTQSVAKMNHKFFTSYIFKSNNPTKWNAYHDLSLKNLEKAAQKNALVEYTLEYLGSYSFKGQTLFSAVFQKTPHALQWILQNDVGYDKIRTECSKWHNMGYVPRLLVGYEKDGQVHFSGMWTAL